MKREMEKLSINAPEVKVDQECMIRDVKVYQNYSCRLELKDIDYNNLNGNKFFKMQMLERNDGKKWIIWTQFGRINTENPQVKEQEFYGRYDAIAHFEKKFYEKTNNKWTDRDHFQQKPGKWALVREGQEKESLKLCAQTEKDLINEIKKSYA